MSGASTGIKFALLKLPGRGRAVRPGARRSKKPPSLRHQRRLATGWTMFQRIGRMDSVKFQDLPVPTPSSEGLPRPPAVVSGWSSRVAVLFG